MGRDNHRSLVKFESPRRPAPKSACRRRSTTWHESAYPNDPGFGWLSDGPGRRARPRNRVGMRTDAQHAPSYPLNHPAAYLNPGSSACTEANWAMTSSIGRPEPMTAIGCGPAADTSAAPAEGVRSSRRTFLRKRNLALQDSPASQTATHAYRCPGRRAEYTGGLHADCPIRGVLVSMRSASATASGFEAGQLPSACHPGSKPTWAQNSPSRRA